MAKNKKRDSINFSTKFILLALIALCLFIFSFFFVLPAVFPKNSSATFNDINEKNNNGFYLNEDYSQKDPLLTEIPNLSDMITGPILADNDPALGPKSAKINIVAYTDFECSYCGRAVNEVKRLQSEMPEKIRFIHKDFPANDARSPSFQASVAARCAGEQDKFWEMADMLYENSHNLNNQLFTRMARQLKLNENKFKKCLENENAKNLVLDNIEEANALKIIGVPLFYINDQEIMGEVSYEEIKKIAEQELNKLQ